MKRRRDEDAQDKEDVEGQNPSKKIKMEVTQGKKEEDVEKRRKELFERYKKALDGKVQDIVKMLQSEGFNNVEVKDTSVTYCIGGGYELSKKKVHFGIEKIIKCGKIIVPFNDDDDTNFYCKEDYVIDILEGMLVCLNKVYCYLDTVDNTKGKEKIATKLELLHRLSHIEQDFRNYKPVDVKKEEEWKAKMKYKYDPKHGAERIWWCPSVDLIVEKKGDSASITFEVSEEIKKQFVDVFDVNHLTFRCSDKEVEDLKYVYNVKY